MKIVEWMVRIIFWLQAFAGILIIFGLIAFNLYSKTESRLASIVFLSVGFLAGIFVAEFIRKNMGLTVFFARIYGPNQMDEGSTDEIK